MFHGTWVILKGRVPIGQFRMPRIACFGGQCESGQSQLAGEFLGDHAALGGCFAFQRGVNPCTAECEATQAEKDDRQVAGTQG